MNSRETIIKRRLILETLKVKIKEKWGTTLYNPLIDLLDQLEIPNYQLLFLPIYICIERDFDPTEYYSLVPKKIDEELERIFGKTSVTLTKEQITGLEYHLADKKTSTIFTITTTNVTTRTTAYFNQNEFEWLKNGGAKVTFPSSLKKYSHIEKITPTTSASRPYNNPFFSTVLPLNYHFACLIIAILIIIDQTLKNPSNKHRPLLISDGEKGRSRTFDLIALIIPAIKEELSRHPHKNQERLNHLIGENNSEEKGERVLNIPIEYICPLSGNIMDEPVNLPDTNISFERAYLEAWLIVYGTNPETGLPATTGDIRENAELKENIGCFIDSYADQRHCYDCSSSLFSNTRTEQEDQQHPLRTLENQGI